MVKSLFSMLLKFKVVYFTSIGTRSLGDSTGLEHPRKLACMVVRQGFIWDAVRACTGFFHAALLFTPATGLCTRALQLCVLGGRSEKLTVPLKANLRTCTL